MRSVLLANLDDAYERRGWHGVNLRGSLRGVTAKAALARPAAGRHNVWELTMHAAYWKYAAWRRLTGAKRGGFPVKGSNWFPSPARASDREWRGVISLLDAMHRQLREAIVTLPDELVEQRQRLIYGVAAHDLYHTGQIQLVKRLA